MIDLFIEDGCIEKDYLYINSLNELVNNNIIIISYSYWYYLYRNKQ